MSAAATFERVYAALKGELRAGRFPPGARLEPAQLCEDLLSSVTPVRDALHRLTGERILEATPHQGFCVPRLTELGLRDLYDWQEELLLLTLRAGKSAPQGRPPGSPADLPPHDRVAALFLEIAAAGANPERAATLANLLDRAGPARAQEARYLRGLEEEAGDLEVAWQAGDAQLLRSRIAAYHRRRQRIVPELVALLAGAR